MRKFENVVILAAGESTRFWPLGNKNLFKIKGKPLISHQIDSLIDYSKKMIVVSCKDNFEEISQLAKGRLNIHVILQDGVGQSAALITAAKKIETNEVLVVNAVDFFNVDYVIEQMQNKKTSNKLILTAKKLPNYFPGGYLCLENGRLTEVIEKPDPHNLPSNKVRLVADYFSDFGEFITILNSFETPLKDGIFEKGLNLYIKKYPSQVTYIEYDDYWISIKYPWSINALVQHLLASAKPAIDNKIATGQNVSISGVVEIEKGVEIGDFVRLVGPTFIGANTKIGNFAMIINSVIESDCLIGGYSEVTRSYLGSNVKLHRNYVGDSVIHTNVLLGAGTILANLRLDGTNVTSYIKGEKVDTGCAKLGAFLGSGVKVGINTSIMPGVKIKKQVHIKPNQIISKDVTS